MLYGFSYVLLLVKTKTRQCISMGLGSNVARVETQWQLYCVRSHVPLEISQRVGNHIYCLTYLIHYLLRRIPKITQTKPRKETLIYIAVIFVFPGGHRSRLCWGYTVKNIWKLIYMKYINIKINIILFKKKKSF